MKHRYDSGRGVPIGDVFGDELKMKRGAGRSPSNANAATLKAAFTFNPELNSRIDELGEYRRGHKKLTPLGVVSGCRLRRDRFCERRALLLEF